MSGKPSESTFATNTRRCAADRRAQAESSLSIESDRPDAKVLRGEESDSASYVLNHYDSDPPRHANALLEADTTRLVPQLSNPPSSPVFPDSVLSALLHQMNNLTAVLATQEPNRAAHLRFFVAISDRRCRLERSRAVRGNRKTTEPQLSAPVVPSPPQSSWTVVSRDESAPSGPPKMRFSTRWDTATTAGAFRESLERVGLWQSWCIASVFPASCSSRWFCCYCIAAVPRRVRKSAVSASFPIAIDSLISAPADAVVAVRPRIISVTRPSSVSLPCSMPPILPPASQSNSNAGAGVVWDAVYRDTIESRIETTFNGSFR